MTIGDEFRVARDRVNTTPNLGRGGNSVARWLQTAQQQWEKDHDPIDSTVLAVARAINYGYNHKEMK